MPKYDYLIVGAGLFGAVFAHEMRAQGKNVLFWNGVRQQVVISAVRNGMV